MKSRARPSRTATFTCLGRIGEVGGDQDAASLGSYLSSFALFIPPGAGRYGASIAFNSATICGW